MKHITNCKLAFNFVMGIFLMLGFVCFTSCQRDPIVINPMAVFNIQVQKPYSYGTIVGKSMVDEFEASVSVVYEDDTVSYSCMFIADGHDDFYAYDYTRSDVLYAVENKPFRVMIDATIVGQEFRGESEIITLESEAITLLMELYPLQSIEPSNFTFVDLGLPSGTQWATCNVGADSPEGYGNYYAWGETSAKQTFTWATYRYCNGSDTTLTKYCSISDYGSGGFTDTLVSLVPSDDVASLVFGTDWRMPTSEDFNELMENCTRTWASQNGVNGYLFTAQNGNSIFLPAAGYVGASDIGVAGSFGRYWSSSLNVDYPVYAEGISFNSGNFTVNGNYRYYGLSVRPVRNQ